MNRWLTRLFIGLVMGLAGLYFQYSSMKPDTGDASVSAEGEGEGEPAVGGVPAQLLKAVQDVQSSGGGRRGRSRAKGR